MTQPWVEKYRPKSIEEISSQDEVVNVLRSAIHSTNLPHLLFYGPPGTGKTSTILAMCKQLFGPNLWRERVLELNASDERGFSSIEDDSCIFFWFFLGIKTVRERIKTFAQVSVGKHVDG